MNSRDREVEEAYVRMCVTRKTRRSPADPATSDTSVTIALVVGFATRPLAGQYDIEHPVFSG